VPGVASCVRFSSGINATDYILPTSNVISYYQEGLKRELKVVFPEQQGGWAGDINGAIR
jgi:hypothetical protein